MAQNRDKSRQGEEIQLTLDSPPPPELEARKWLEETSHREGCQCHRCFWAHGVVAGRVQVGFEKWRER